MHESKLALVAGFLVLAINGCGDAGGSTADGAIVDSTLGESTPQASVDATCSIDTPPPQIDGPSTGDIDGGVPVDVATASCYFPRCYAALVEDCAPQGRCVMSGTSVAGGTANAVCFDNGVKGLVTSTFIASSRIISTKETWKNPSGICYSLEPSSRGPSSVSYTMRDGAAAVLATVTTDDATNTMTFTCNDEAPVIVSVACAGGPSSTRNGRLSQCTRGDCTF
jgi:hypothetical protein